MCGDEEEDAEGVAEQEKLSKHALLEEVGVVSNPASPPGSM